MNLVRLNRDIFLPNRTIGIWRLDKSITNYAYSMEDAVRPGGLYVKKETAIPEGDFELVMTYSNRFKVVMPLVLNKQFTQNPVLFHGVDISNCGIRIHGGNDDEDTEGCPLMGANRDGYRIWNCKAINDAFRKELARSLKKGKVYLEIRNFVPSV